MELLTLLTLLVLGMHVLNTRDQRARVALLGSHLGKYRIENLMESLIQGYLRALGEADLQRQAAIWGMLETTEVELCEQFNAFVLDFATVPEPQARVSKLWLALPYATRWMPALTFDVRKLLGVHAHAMTHAANKGLPLPHKAKAFTLMAELLLLQHTCHWFCRSKLVASARLLARHQTPYAQVLASVAPQTRQAYCALVGC
ncbi:MAG TPA: hypothetical protein PLB25_09615 [Rhodoferax sp.]|nr:hypothetical protein [Rhodoferax sp.]